MNAGLNAEIAVAVEAVIGQMHQAVTTLQQALTDERRALDAGSADALPWALHTVCRVENHRRVAR